MTIRIPPAAFDEFRTFLARRGFAFEDRPHQEFLARGRNVVVNLYTNGKVVIGGSDDLHRREIEFFLTKLGGDRASGRAKGSGGAGERFTGTRIGLDEAGKGDYFGPLVIAGVLVADGQADELRQLGVRDSKGLSDDQARRIAGDVRDAVGSRYVTTVVLRPERYNEMHDDMGNLNKMMGWAHATALEELLEARPDCPLAVIDKFGPDRHVTQRLGPKGRDVRIVQVPRAEADVAVAAASIVARARFLDELDALSDEFDVRLPKGATHVVGAGKEFVTKHGRDALRRAAKVHFRTTQRVLGDR